MIVSLDAGRLRCSLCAYEWTPWEAGVRPLMCPGCLGCRGCARRSSPDTHRCDAEIETGPQRVLRNLEGLPTDLIDAIRRSASRE